IYKAILSCRQNGFYFDNLIEKVGLSVRDVQRIYRKAVKLSEKEILLLRMLAEDMLTKEISQQLRLSSRRVEALRQDMKAKIGAKTIAGLIAFGVRNKLID
ncbi:MAG TPA: LuxR C-terminal-related transcriptional regulator, partial [Chitinophagaceae bacterium]